MWAALYGARSGARTKRGLLPFPPRQKREKICITVEAGTSHTAHWKLNMNNEQSGMAVIQNARTVVCSFEWLLYANINARKGKRYRPEIMAFATELATQISSPPFSYMR